MLWIFLLTPDKNSVQVVCLANQTAYRPIKQSGALEPSVAVMSLLPRLRSRTSVSSTAPSRAGSLSNLSRGQEATILEVRGSSLFAARLRELGFTPGIHIRVVRSGWTVVVQIGEGRLCLRKRDAASVLIQPEHLPFGSPVVVPDHHHRIELDETLLNS
jgi:Fe2+ transport system protein FeoA